MSVETAFGPIDVTVTVLWGAGVGARDGLGLIEANRAMIEQIALMKLEAGEVEDACSVKITALDIEG